MQITSIKAYTEVTRLKIPFQAPVIWCLAHARSTNNRKDAVIKMILVDMLATDGYPQWRDDADLRWSDFVYALSILRHRGFVWYWSFRVVGLPSCWSQANVVLSWKYDVLYSYRFGIQDRWPIMVGDSGVYAFSALLMVIHAPDRLMWTKMKISIYCILLRPGVFWLAYSKILWSYEQISGYSHQLLHVSLTVIGE
jgi:hypothetical protein